MHDKIIDSMFVQSAHTIKDSPRDLSSFKEKLFPGNITAYKVDWKANGSPQEFPIKSAQELGISEKAFTAIKILFPYLDKVFRATGAQFIPQQHSTVANHLAGLQNLCDEIFIVEPRLKFTESQQVRFDDLAKQTRLVLMLHDISEIPGEISTFCQRLPKEKLTETTITETDRQELEQRVAKKLIWHSLKAAYANRKSLPRKLHQAITKCQDQVSKQVSLPEERYKLVDEFYKSLPEIDDNYGSKKFKQDYEKLWQAYLPEKKGKNAIHNMAIAALAKLIDKLESKFHCAIVGDYSKFDFEPKYIIEKEFAQFKEFREKYSHLLLSPILKNLANLFKTSVTIYREWPQLGRALEEFRLWEH